MKSDGLKGWIMLLHAASKGSKTQAVWEVRGTVKPQRGASFGFYYTQLLIQCHVPYGLSKICVGAEAI